MTAPQYTAGNLLAQLLRLLPRGRAWPRDPASVMGQALATLVPSFERSASVASGMIADALPSTTDQLLPEWQETLGLPDPCAGPVQSTAQARAQVVARFTDGGGQSQAYMIAYAAALGYEIQIVQFASFRAGQSRCGQPLGGTDWSNTWQIVAPSTTATQFRCGASRCGDPLQSWGNAVLVCEMQAIAPAHKVLLFSFTLPASA
jgi:uncharacterized protein YmfQ (DUF2313 family)